MPPLRSIALSVAEVDSSSLPSSQPPSGECTPRSNSSNALFSPSTSTPQSPSSLCPSLSLETVTSRLIGTIPVVGSAQTETEVHRTMKLESVFLGGSVKPSEARAAATFSVGHSNFNRSRPHTPATGLSIRRRKELVEGSQKPRTLAQRRDAMPVRIDTEGQLVQTLSRGDGMMKDMQRKLIQNFRLCERSELERIQESICNMQSAENSLLQRMMKHRDQSATRPLSPRAEQEKPAVPASAQSGHDNCRNICCLGQIEELKVRNKRLNQELKHVVQQLREMDSKNNVFDISCKKSWNSSVPANNQNRVNVIAAQEKVKQLRIELGELRAEVVSTTNSTQQSQEAEKVLYKSLRSLFEENHKLRESLHCESRKRRDLHNELLDLKGNIRVFARCRPLLAKDSQNKGDASDQLKAVEFSPADSGTLTLYVPNPGRKGTGASREGDMVARHFDFDRVFRDNESQDEVFADVRPFVTSAMDGYNVCVFAYGQTGSGKTFTMEGDSTSQGVVFRAMSELVTQAEARRDELKVQITASMLEVYNEGIHDLLIDRSKDSSTPKLEIKNAQDGTAFVEGLTKRLVTCPEEIRGILTEGQRNRSVSYTSCNDRSSRSHSLLCLNIECLTAGDETTAVSHGKLWLVDLAGSERLSKSIVEGTRLKEAKNINKSLSALGDVISALATKASHVPYRNSKLTRLLQDSLGKSAKILMIVQISPAWKDASESHCSLLFAERARGVELGPAKKHLKRYPSSNATSQISELRKQILSKTKAIDKMKNDQSSHSMEVDTLKAKLKDMAAQLSAVTSENNKNIAIIRSMNAQSKELQASSRQAGSISRQNQCFESSDVHDPEQSCGRQRRITIDFSALGRSLISDEEKENHRPVLESNNRCGHVQSVKPISLNGREVLGSKRAHVDNRLSSRQEINHKHHLRDINVTGAKTRVVANAQNSGARRVPLHRESSRPRWS